MSTKLAQFQPVSDRPKFSVAQIPALRDVSKEVADIEEKIKRMLAQRAQLDAERLALLRESRDPNAPAMRRKSREEALLATMLGVPTTGLADLSSDHTRVTEQIEALDSGLRLMQTALDAAKVEASVIVCKQLSGVHASLAREVAICMLAVHRACCEYEAFSFALNGREISWSQFQPLFPRFIGNPNDNYSQIAWYLRAAVQAGALALEELPENIRFG